MHLSSLLGLERLPVFNPKYFEGGYLVRENLLGMHRVLRLILSTAKVAMKQIFAKIL